jgi:hypothetical protein
MKTDQRRQPKNTTMEQRWSKMSQTNNHKPTQEMIKQPTSDTTQRKFQRRRQGRVFSCVPSPLSYFELLGRFLCRFKEILLCTPKKPLELPFFLSVHPDI